jgi:dTDP-4-dehydrorhamnose reductase
VNRLTHGDEVTVFHDRIVSPTYVIDAASATHQLFRTGAPIGLYHCVNSGHCSWLELTRELARRLGVEPRLVPMRMADVTLRAARPQYSALSVEKLQRVGIAMPTWQDAIQRFLATERST